ncbi:MAG: hypothetical protein WC833_08750 [Bacteroidales bacterium]|jgi:hypothetical protein
MNITEEFNEKQPRWRAEHGEEYYYLILNNFGEFVIFRGFDYRHINDEKYYDSGNYFRTEKEAKKYINIIKDILTNRK